MGNTWLPESPDLFMARVAAFLGLPRDVVADMPLRDLAQLALAKTAGARMVVDTTGESVPPSSSSWRAA